MKKFDFNKLTMYKAVMDSLGLGAMVFDQEPRLQFGYDGESYYIDEFSDDEDKFVMLVESEDFEYFKRSAASYFLNK